MITFFLSNKGTDIEGRTFEEVLAFNDEQLEDVHNYIQWLFPLPEPSNVYMNAPVLDKEEIQQIRESEVIQKNLKRARDRLKQFYADTDHWLEFHDHNHLRITRILKSTLLLTGRDEAEDFYDFLMEKIRRAEREKPDPADIKYWTDTLSITFD